MAMAIYLIQLALLFRLMKIDTDQAVHGRIAGIAEAISIAASVLYVLTAKL